MITPHDVKTLSRARSVWLAERRLGLGGSDWYELLGEKRSCKLRLLLDKRGTPPSWPNPETSPMRLGQELERGLLLEYVARTGHAILTPDEDALDMAVPPLEEWPWLRGNPDALACDGDTDPFSRAVEAKHTSLRTFLVWKAEGLGIPKVAQIHHYLWRFGLEAGDFACRAYDDLSKVHIFEIQRDEKLIDEMKKLGSEFWKLVHDQGADLVGMRHDPKSTPCSACPYFPDCHGAELTKELTQDNPPNLWRVDNDDEGLVDDACIRWAQARRAASEAKAELEAAKAELVALADTIADGKVGRVMVGDMGLPVLFYNQTRSSYQAAALEAAFPKEDLDRCKKTTITRSARVGRGGRDE